MDVISFTRRNLTFPLSKGGGSLDIIKWVSRNSLQSRIPMNTAYGFPKSKGIMHVICLIKCWVNLESIGHKCQYHCIMRPITEASKLIHVTHGVAESHCDVIKWKHFSRYWPFVRGIHRSPVNSPHKGQWRRDLMFSLIYAWMNSWVNNGEAGDLRRHRAHYDVIVMVYDSLSTK